MVNLQQDGLQNIVTERKVLMKDKYNHTVANTYNLHVIRYQKIRSVLLNIYFALS